LLTLVDILKDSAPRCVFTDTDHRDQLREAGPASRLRRNTGLAPGKILLLPLRKRFGPRLWILASGGAPLEPEQALKLEAPGW
jgi:hypothetical protein